MLPTLGRPHVLRRQVRLKNRDAILKNAILFGSWNSLFTIQGENVGRGIQGRSTRQPPEKRTLSSTAMHAPFTLDANDHLVADHEVSTMKRSKTVNQGVLASQNLELSRDS